MVSNLILAWDMPVSPLHLAILNGHIAVIEMLVSKFGADVLLPVKLINAYSRSPRGAILTLVLAAQLPGSKATDIARTLLALGASSSQADMSLNSALQYAVALQKIGVLKAIFEVDGAAASSALNIISIGGYISWDPKIHTPLMIALKNEDSDMVQTLLDYGAKSHISFEDFAQAYVAREQNRLSTIDSKRVREAFQTRFLQPVMLAVDKNMPAFGQQFLKLGADVNSLTSDGGLAVVNNYHRAAALSLLDTVNDKIKALHAEINPDDSLDSVELNDAAFYYGKHVPGTYAYWCLSKELEVAKGVMRDLKRGKEQPVAKEDQEKLQARRDTLTQLLKEFQLLRQTVLELGGQTFAELHPTIGGGPKENPAKHQAFQPKLTFQISDLTDHKQEAYLKL